MSDQNQNPLATINITDVKGQMADQLRSFMMSLIPKEAFDKAIQDCWERLTKPRKVNKGDNYSPRWVEEPSELDQMITEEMRKQLKEKVTAWGKEWGKTYDADEAAKEVLAELMNHAAGAFIRNAARGIVEGAIDLALADRDATRLNCKNCHQPTELYSTCRCGHYNSTR